MSKELINTLEELSNKSTTELALNIMELTTNNLIKEQEIKKLQERIQKAIDFIQGNCYDYDTKECISDLIYYKCDEVLDILKGGNNE